MEPGFDIEISADRPAALTVRLSGELDLAARPVVNEQVTGALVEEATIERVVVDLGGVKFCDSSGLGALLDIRRAAEKFGAAIVLRAPSAGRGAGPRHRRHRRASPPGVTDGGRGSTGRPSGSTGRPSVSSQPGRIYVCGGRGQSVGIAGRHPGSERQCRPERSAQPRHDQRSVPRLLLGIDGAAGGDLHGHPAHTLGIGLDALGPRPEDEVRRHQSQLVRSAAPPTPAGPARPSRPAREVCGGRGTRAAAPGRRGAGPGRRWWLPPAPGTPGVRPGRVPASRDRSPPGGS